MGSRFTGYAPRTGRAAGASKQPASYEHEGARRGVEDTVNVEIRGKRLAIRTDRDPSYVHQIAGYYDAKLRDLQALAPTATLDKLMMLAGLTLVEELFDAQAELAQMRHEVSARADALLELLDREAAAQQQGEE